MSSKEKVIHFMYGGTPFCGTRVSNPKMTNDPDAATCKKCLDKWDKQDAVGGGQFRH